MSLVRYRGPALSRRPIRSFVFRAHMLCGLGAGAYLALMGATGALLMFRPELQERAYPHFFRRSAPDAAQVPIDAIIDAVHRRYPDESFSGVDFPSQRRGTFLVYVTKGDDFRAVFLDGATGVIVGEMPKSGWIHQLQELHFHLWAGARGLAANGVGALILSVLCATGLVIAWPGTSGWVRAFVVSWRVGWRRALWESHRATGTWVLALVATWATTGMYFAFPGPVISMVGVVSQTSQPVPLASVESGGLRHVSFQALVDRARTEVPHAQVARLHMPSRPGGAAAVVLATKQHGDWDASDERTVHFDGAGIVIGVTDAAQRPAGAKFLTWMGLLHVGNFGGWPVKLLWATGALALPLLAASGALLWWVRTARAGRTRGAVRLPAPPS